MKNYLTMLVLAVGVSLGGYAFAEHHEHADHGTEAHKDIGEMKEAGNKICPVDGEKIGSMGEAVKIEHKGKIYNLCCAACEMKFKEDPEKYVGIVNKELKKGTSESVDESQQIKSEDMAKVCPVCGPEEGMAGKDDITYEYEGQTYYFCSPDCLKAFKEDPETFIKKMDGKGMNEESHEGHDHKSHSDHEDHEGHDHK